MSIFEAVMLLCFGAAWPFSIYRSWTSRTSEGKSVIFLFVLMAGYISGICHKIIFHFDWVIALYCLNLTMVAIDTCLYFRNKKIQKGREVDFALAGEALSPEQ